MTPPPVRDKSRSELTDTSEQEISLLKRMEAWAARYETMPRTPRRRS